MSAAAPAENSQTPSTATKKKNKSKKKSAKNKSNGDAGKIQDSEKDLHPEVGDEEEDADDSEQVNVPKESQPSENIKPQTNGHHHDPTKNKTTASSFSTAQPAAREDVSEDSIEGNASDRTDASVRFEAMSKEREALRAEVEQLRKALEGIQGKHAEELSKIMGRHSEELSTIQGKHSEEVSSIKEQLTGEVQTIKAELQECETAKEQAETQYQHLLGRVNTIKASLGERLKADKQELAEAKDQIEELESHNENLQNRVKSLEADVKRLEEQSNESSKELSSLRNRHNLSQQNWVHEREDLMQQTRQLKDEAEAAKEAMGDWEVLAMEERAIRENLENKVSDMEEQFLAQKEAYEAAVAEKDSQSQTVDGLQRALQEIQEARKRELREMVESTEEQVQALKKLVQESDSRATEAASSKGSLQAELSRLAPFEKEVKEKNLLIGKLRHEAIVLNDHLTKALKFLKKAKPEDNIDRQIVTNHFLHFLALDRSDPKKFQILQLIASLLNWTEEQKEQAGLARPGTSSSSLRLPISPFHRTPSTPALSSEFFTDNSTSKESLADLWTVFLERSAEEGSVKDSRSGSPKNIELPDIERPADRNSSDDRQ
ncbi:hypothetical protein B7494_g241 [Chlorociboria aeruginascens]|nr:hypothetical protein B7494_g241 [Chlorociboria aeruginascens]